MRKGHFCLLFLATTIITTWNGKKKREKTSEDKFDSQKKNRNEQIAYCGMPPEGFSGAMTTE